MLEKSNQKEETRERILEAALDIIEEKTIAGTRLRQIAEKAQLFQSNIHYYFKSKRDLLLAVQHKVLEKCIEMRTPIRLAVGVNLDFQLDAFIQQKKEFILNLKKYDYAEIDFWVQARSDEAIKREFCNSFINWREEIIGVLNTFAPAMEAKQQVLCAALFVSLLEGATIQYMVDPKAFDLDSYFDLCKQLMKNEVLKSSSEGLV